MNVSTAILAQHECAHAVMRKLCWLEAMQLSVDELGNGLCEGTGERIGLDEALLVTLAGIAWETGCRFTLIDWEATRLSFGDAAEAWQLVSSSPLLRVTIEEGAQPIVQEPARALDRWLAKASDMLKPHSSLIRSMGSLLASERHLSARRVAKLLRGTFTQAVSVEPTASQPQPATPVRLCFRRGFPATVLKFP